MTSSFGSKRSRRDGGRAQQTGCFTISQLRSKSRDFLSVPLSFFSVFFPSFFCRSTLLLPPQQDHACCNGTQGRQIETSLETSQRPVEHENSLFHLGDNERKQKHRHRFQIGGFGVLFQNLVLQISKILIHK